MISFDDFIKEIIKEHNSYWQQNPEDPYEAKYQFLIKKREDIGKKHLNDSKEFIEYSNNMVDIYENIEDHNPNKKRKILIALMM